MDEFQELSESDDDLASLDAKTVRKAEKNQPGLGDGRNSLMAGRSSIKRWAVEKQHDESGLRLRNDPGAHTRKSVAVKRGVTNPRSGSVDHVNAELTPDDSQGYFAPDRGFNSRFNDLAGPEVTNTYLSGSSGLNTDPSLESGFTSGTPFASKRGSSRRHSGNPE